MKKALVLALALLLGIGVAAFGGWHFTLEQNPLLPEATMTVGWDFDGARIGTSNVFLDGDFYTTRDNLWAYPNPWDCGFALGINYEGVLFFALGMDVLLTPTAYPDYINLDTWTTTIKLAGKPSRYVTVWGEVEFTFDVVNPPGPPGWTGIWTFTPTIGIEVRLP